MLALRRVVAMRPRALTMLAVGVVLLVPASSSASQPARSLTSGPHAFTISSSIHVGAPGADPAAGCPGALATLWPGVTRCLVYRVHNRMDVPITVRSITVGLDPAFPPPPQGCSSDKLALPTFSGAFIVPPRGSTLSPGVPILLKNASTNQDDCKQTVIHFVYAGMAVYDDATQHGAHRGTQQGTSHLAFTGADVAAAALAGLALMAAGCLLVVVARRTRRSDGESP